MNCGDATAADADRNHCCYYYCYRPKDVVAATATGTSSACCLSPHEHIAAVDDDVAGNNQQQQQQQQSSGAANAVRMPPPTSGGINEPQECPYCRRTFSCYYSLKRHFQDKHEQSDTLYVCEFCHRRYRTKNSLTTHKSLQHRGSSGMLKRLLKTTAIKSVLGAASVAAAANAGSPAGLQAQQPRLN